MKKVPSNSLQWKLSQHPGIFALNSKTSRHQTWWILEVARLGSAVTVSLWKTGVPIVLSRRLSNFRAVRPTYFSWFLFRDIWRWDVLLMMNKGPDIFSFKNDMRYTGGLTEADLNELAWCLDVASEELWTVVFCMTLTMYTCLSVCDTASRTMLTRACWGMNKWAIFLLYFSS